MALFGHSDQDLLQRERELSRRHKEIKELLQRHQQEIGERFQSLGNLDAAIMTKSNLELMYKEQVEVLEAQKQQLRDTIASYQSAAQGYLDMQAALAEREQKVITQECIARSSFASQFEEQMAPLKQYQQELEGKEQRVITMLEEFNKNFAVQDQKLLSDFQRLNADLQAKFEVLQAELVAERKRLSERENGLNEREATLVKREADIQQGLSCERAQLMQEVANEREQLTRKELSLQEQREALLKRKEEMDNLEAALAERIAVVQFRESEASAQFAQQKQAMLAEIQTIRVNSANSVIELQKEAANSCDQLLVQWQENLAAERQKMLEQLTAESQLTRQELNVEKQALAAEKQRLQEQSAAQEAREFELQKREERARQTAEFLNEKERILSDKFQRIAEERIAASQAESQAILQSRDAVAAKLASVTMELEALKLRTNN